MTGLPSSGKKSVLLTSAQQPEVHPLATVIHDANNKLQIASASMELRRTRFSRQRFKAMMDIADDIRFANRILLHAAKNETFIPSLFMDGFEFMRRKIMILLGHIQDATNTESAMPHRITNLAIGELDALMERGLNFIQDEPPEDPPTLGNLSEHVSDIASDYRDRHPNILFHFDIEANCKALFHPPSVKRALENLLNNSIQALPEEGGEITIKLQSKSIDSNGKPFAEIEDGPYITIAIEDNGSGISEGILDKLRHSTVTTKREEGGSGFGLVSARKGVRNQGTEKQGAHLIVTSEAGCGTTVTALIPSSFPPPRNIPADNPEGEATDVSS